MKTKVLDKKCAPSLVDGVLGKKTVLACKASGRLLPSTPSIRRILVLQKLLALLLVRRVRVDWEVLDTHSVGGRTSAMPQMLVLSPEGAYIDSRYGRGRKLS